ncbi:hypothetical protein BGZ82_001343 [Podila clonocystis]|nr:hypothetical protein BGZ82_001343 [Podila clonocystis]
MANLSPPFQFHHLSGMHMNSNSNLAVKQPNNMIRCDRLEPTCSSCIKYKATCLRTAFPAGAPLSTVSTDAIGPGLRIQTTIGKRDRHYSEAEVLDSCLRDVQKLQVIRLRRIEQFFDRLGIDEKRLDEVSWIAEQIRTHEANNPSLELHYQPEEIIDKLGPRASVPWIRQILPLLQASKKVQQVPSTVQAYSKGLPISQLGNNTTALQATLTEAGEFICPSPKPVPFPTRVPLSVLNKTMFELSVYDHTEYLGPVAGTRASTWSEEMRFPLPWLVPEPQVQESLLVLPSMEQMLELIEWMILSPLYTYFPILNKASILNALSSALPGPSYTREMRSESSTLPQRITGRVSAVFLLNAIFALGAAYRSNAIEKNLKHRLLPDKVSRDTSSYDFQLFFDRSRALTVYILDQPRVSSLQGLLLLMKCPAIPGIQNLYREQACAMALALGLHRDPEPWTLCQSVIQMRRNIFWCCYAIDASYSLSSGSPERFPDDYITIGLPNLPSIENGDDIGEIEAETESNRIGFLIEQAKLWRIVKKIRRCGQASNKSQDGYSDASNIYSHQGTFSGVDYTHPSGSPPPWVWRADSSRRILDVELAQWQMELPDKLRFDFGLTKQDAPCPFLVRVNGLGAMLQLIFNEVLILLHHPFLVFADSQAQMHKEGAQPARPISKGRSSISSAKSPRSRRSSSISKSPYTPTPGLSQSEDRIKATRSLPPFLNSCTKAAEAITFLIDHLLRTTPEWLVCHNEVDSALHIAERVHALNVSLANGVAAGNSSFTMMSTNLQHAKNQFKRTRSFRKIVSELDQFTMSSGYRPELVTQEYRIRGSAGERLMRCMKQLLVHQRNADYYRLPRSPPGKDANIHGPEYDGVDPALPGGQDHLEMRLAFANQRIWIQYYNIRIKDGEESRNGAESWVEILTPYTPAPDYEIDLGDEVSQDFGHPSDRTMTHFEDDSTNHSFGDPHPRSRNKSTDDYSPVGLGEPMDPPQVSSSALMDLFRNPDPSGLGQYSAIPTGRGGPYDPNQQHHPHHTFQPHSHPHHQQPFSRKEYGPMEPGYDAPIYIPGNYSAQDVSLENFDRIEPPLSLDSPNHERVPEDQSFRVFHPDQQGRGYPDHHQQPPYSHTQLMQQQVQGHAPVQSGQHGNFQNFEMQGPPVLGFENSLSSPSYSSPGSPSLASSESSIGLGLISNPSLTIPSQLSYDAPYLGLIQQHFPNHAPQASSSMLGVSDPSHPLSLSQQLDSSFATTSTQQAIRPFYGMPMGGFMSPTLAALPEIRSHNRNIHNLLQSPSMPEASPGFSSAPSTGSVSSVITSEVSTSMSSSPASPLTQSAYRMVLSPTTDALQGISNRLNSWNGLSSATESEQDQESRNQEQYQQPPTFPLMDYPVNGVPIAHRGSSASTSQYANSWSSSSPNSESTNTPSSIQTDPSSSSRDLMDGVVASPTLTRKSANSAVPDLPNAGHGQDWD